MTDNPPQGQQDASHGVITGGHEKRGRIRTVVRAFRAGFYLWPGGTNGRCGRLPYQHAYRSVSFKPIRPLHGSHRGLQAK
jgi:hypothetical protein